MFTTAAFENLRVGESQGGLFFLKGSYDKCNLINWQLNHMKKIIPSTLVAEKIAVVIGVAWAV